MSRETDSPAPVLTREISYRDRDVALRGILHWTDGPHLPAPGILLVHGGAGLDRHARDQAHRYATLGYTVFACDMLGPDVEGDRKRIIASLTALRDDPAFLLRRGEAGLAALSECAESGTEMAAIGYCFGGMAVLALARSGTDLRGVVSIHGTLTTVRPAEPGGVKGRVLVCHGAADPHVPMDTVTTFAEEMDAAGADWQLVIYGRAQHGFTHEHAVPGAVPGVAYDPDADERSFAATGTFLADAFGR